MAINEIGYPAFNVFCSYFCLICLR